MKRLALITGTFLLCLLGEDSPRPQPINRNKSNEFKLLGYQAREAESALEKIRTRQKELYADICADAGISAKDFNELITMCSVDLEKDQVSRQPAKTK